MILNHTGPDRWNAGRMSSATTTSIVPSRAVAMSYEDANERYRAGTHVDLVTVLWLAVQTDSPFASLLPHRQWRGCQDRQVAIYDPSPNDFRRGIDDPR